MARFSKDWFLTARRVLTIGIWPLLDWVVTAFANFSLVYFRGAEVGLLKSIFSTAAIAAILNIGYLYLLGREKWIPEKLSAQAEKFLELQSRIPFLDRWKSLAILAVYAVSGPAAAGTPLLWLLGFKGKKAYLLATIGVTINSIIWVGGVYNILQQLLLSLMRDLVGRL
ncbi:MAG: hypothetical protein Q7S60_02820 [bacterium]|nr:hypothetical protein [bacterium]